MMQQLIWKVVPHHPRSYEGKFSSYDLVYNTKKYLSQTYMHINDLVHIVYKNFEQLLIGSYFRALRIQLLVNLFFYLFVQTVWI